MKTAQYVIGLVAFIMLVGLILRYGKSSHLLAGDFNSLIGTLTLQGSQTKYYGP